MGNDKNISTDLKYAQWNPYFHSLQKDIDQIKEINKVVRKDTNFIPDFFSVINTLYNANVVYSPEMQKKLSIIETKIFDPKYQRDLKEKNNLEQIKKFQYKLIKELEQCFQMMITQFESNGLLPKRIMTDKSRLGALNTMS